MQISACLQATLGFFPPLLLYRVDPMAQQLKKKKSYLTIDQYLIKAEGEA